MTTTTQVQYRRGAASQIAAFTGAQGEVVVDTTNDRVVVQDGATAGGFAAAKLSEVVSIAQDTPACGRLSYVSATQIKFALYNGQLVKIAGAIYQIPSSGVTAANTGVYVNGTGSQNLANATRYYVYLFNNAGTLTVNFSTTTHATDTTAGNVGVETMTGNNAYTLIGMVYTTSAGQFQNSASLLGVRSWFNRSSIISSVALGNLSTTSTSLVQLSTSGVVVLNWADEDVTISLNGQAWTYLGGQSSSVYSLIGIGVDGTNSSVAFQYVYADGIPDPLAVVASYLPSEGVHTYYAVGQASSGSGQTAYLFNATWYFRTRG